MPSAMHKNHTRKDISFSTGRKKKRKREEVRRGEEMKDR